MRYNLIYQAALEPELHVALRMIREALELDYEPETEPTRRQWRMLDYHQRAQVLGAWIAEEATRTARRMQEPVTVPHFSTIGD